MRRFLLLSAVSMPIEMGLLVLIMTGGSPTKMQELWSFFF
jgi:hypothetical protein